MTKGKFAILAVVLTVGLLVGVIWAQPVGFRASPVLQTSTTATGKPIEFPLFRNQIVAFLVEIAPGGQAGRHQHPRPVFVYVLDGELTWEAEGQPARLYKGGQAIVEDVNVWHNAYNRTNAPLKFLVVFMAEEGLPTTIRP